jgi:hypothetical protein
LGNGDKLKFHAKILREILPRNLNISNLGKKGRKRIGMASLKEEVGAKRSEIVETETALCIGTAKKTFTRANLHTTNWFAIVRDNNIKMVGW